MRPSPQKRNWRWLRQVDRYMVLAILGVFLFVLLTNSVASSIENDIVSSAKSRSSSAPSRTDQAASSITSVRINTRTVGEYGLEHVRDVMHYVWPHLSQLPALQAHAADLAYVLGSAALPGFSTQSTDAHVMELAAKTDAMSTLMALTAVVSLADGKANTVRALRGELGKHLAKSREADTFARALAQHASEADQKWSAETDALLLRRYGAASTANTTTAAARHGRPSLADHVDLYEALLVAWMLGKKQSTALLSAYRLGVESLIVERVRTQSMTNHTIVGVPAALGDASQLFPSPKPGSCRVAALLASGVRFGAHPRHLADEKADDAAAVGSSHRARVTDQAVLDVAESIASSCAARTWHRAVSNLVYVDPSSAHVFANRNTFAPPAHCAESAEVMHMYYALYLTTKDALYAVWALRAFSSSRQACHSTPELLSAHAGAVVSAFLKEFRYFSYLMHALYCAQHLPVRQEKALCRLHEKAIRWSDDSEYMMILPDH